jgi:RHS repeat-associated protein
VASVNCNSGSTWAQTFGYDAFGNVTKSGTGSWLPTYNQSTNRIQSIPGASVSYDANGNLLGDGAHSYTWDGNWGNPSAITTSATGMIGLTYDALGRMVEQNRNGNYTQIVYGPGGGKLALMSGQSLQKAFVPLPGGGTAVYNGGGLAYYRHPDWLGSSRLASTQSRTVYAYTGYAPFGESYESQGTADFSFTGQNEDTVSGSLTNSSPGLYDFPYREYDPAQGRWISPDPAGSAAVDPTNPQSWNRYAYVLNNPLSLTDASGLDDGCGDMPADALAADTGQFPCIQPPEPPAMPPDIDPCQGQPDSCYDQEEADSVAGAAQLLAMVAGMNPACQFALATARKNLAGVQRAASSWSALQQATSVHGMDPSLLAAIGVRESNFLNRTENDGKGVGVGVFQITVSPDSGVTAAQAGNLPWAANYAASLLTVNGLVLAARFPSFSADSWLQATAASYNIGTNPKTSITGNPSTIDVGTASDNYGSNVVQLLQCFEF